MTRALQQIARRIRLLVNRGVLTGSNDAGTVQRLQVSLLPGEVADNVQHMQPFGLSSRAPIGAEAVAASIGGARSHLVVLVVSDGRYRIKNLQGGEAALHNAFGDVVLLNQDGTIEVTARTAVKVTAPEVTVTASTKVVLDTPLVEATQDLQVSGNISSNGDISASGSVSDTNGSMQEMRDIYNAHGSGAPSHPPGDMQ